MVGKVKFSYLDRVGNGATLSLDTDYKGCNAY